MQLHPREKFIITRQLQNSYITDTFYVRAVIRNAKTDTVIQTYDLTDKGSQRFTKEWMVPADPSGQGFYVSIVTSVYSDSGYTTKSDIYGDEEQTYLVQERYVFNPNYPAGPSGQDIDYKRIQKMIDDSFRKFVSTKPETIVVTKEVIKEVKIPEVKIVEKFNDIDTAPILSAIKAVGKKVDDKEVTEIPEMPEPVDLSPIVDSMKTVFNQFDKRFGNIEDKIDSMQIKVSLNDFLPKETIVKPTMNNSNQVDDRVKRLIKIK